MAGGGLVGLPSFGFQLQFSVDTTKVTPYVKIPRASLGSGLPC